MSLTLQEVIDMQSVIFQVDGDSEDKLSVLEQFLAEKTEFRQSVAFGTLSTYANKAVKTASAEAGYLVERLQEKDLLPQSFERLIMIGAPGAQLVEGESGVSLTSTEGRYCKLVLKWTTSAETLASIIENDDVDALKKLAGTELPVQPITLSISVKTFYQAKDRTHQLDLLDAAVLYGALRCCRLLIDSGLKFSKLAPTVAMFSLNEAQFYDLGMEIPRDLSFFEVALLEKQMWVFRTPVFENFCQKEAIANMAEGEFVFLASNKLRFYTYATSLFTADVDISDYLSNVELCEILYDEESSPEIIKNALIKNPNFAALSAASNRRPKKFDMFLDIAYELMQSGVLKLHLDKEGEYMIINREMKLGRTLKEKGIPTEQIYWMKGKSTVEELHPGHSKLFGFAIYENNPDVFNTFEVPKSKSFSSFYGGRGDDSSMWQGKWITKAAKFGSDKCFEIAVINGVKLPENISVYAIQGGNTSIIKQCVSNAGHYEFSSALYYRRLNIVEYLLEVPRATSEPQFFFQPSFVLGFQFLPITVLTQFIYPTPKIARVLMCATGIDYFERVVNYVLKEAIKEGFSSLETAHWYSSE